MLAWVDLAFVDVFCAVLATPAVGAFAAVGGNLVDTAAVVLTGYRYTFIDDIGAIPAGPSRPTRARIIIKAINAADSIVLARVRTTFVDLSVTVVTMPAWHAIAAVRSDHLPTNSTVPAPGVITPDHSRGPSVRNLRQIGRELKRG